MIKSDSDAETFALTYGVEMSPLVFADLLAVTHRVVPRLGECSEIVVCNVAIEFWPLGLDFVDITLRGFEFLLQEYRQVNLAHKADALRVLALGGGEVLLLGNATYLRLLDIADGEHRITQLLLRKLAEKITLIFILVCTGQQSVCDRSIGCDLRAFRQ